MRINSAVHTKAGRGTQRIWLATSGNSCDSWSWIDKTPLTNRIAILFSICASSAAIILSFVDTAVQRTAGEKFHGAQRGNRTCTTWLFLAWSFSPMKHSIRESVTSIEDTSSWRNLCQRCIEFAFCRDIYMSFRNPVGGRSSRKIHHAVSKPTGTSAMMGSQREVGALPNILLTVFLQTPSAWSRLSLGRRILEVNVKALHR